VIHGRFEIDGLLEMRPRVSGDGKVALLAPGQGEELSHPAAEPCDEGALRDPGEIANPADAEAGEGFRQLVLRIQQVDRQGGEEGRFVTGREHLRGTWGPGASSRGDASDSPGGGDGDHGWESELLGPHDEGACEPRLRVEERGDAPGVDVDSGLRGVEARAQRSELGSGGGRERGVQQRVPGGALQSRRGNANAELRAGGAPVHHRGERADPFPGGLGRDGEDLRPGAGAGGDGEGSSPELGVGS
jgi:hypothetical protein